MTVSPVVWATVDDVAVYLGIPAAAVAADEWLTASTDAANAVAYRRRLAAGYHDGPVINPLDPPVVATDPDVKHGVVLYAGALYRERGAVDGYASFVELGTFTPGGGTWGQVQRLWGVQRMAVG